MSDVKKLNLNIDENNLLGEWQGQASLMFDYGVQLADAMQEEDEAAAELAVQDAILAREIRANPDNFDLSKVTESTVPACILEQPEHTEALEELNKARYRVRVLRAAVNAINDRRSALKGMTELFMRQWYADPSSACQPPELRAVAKPGPPTKKITKRRVRRPVED